MNRYLKKILPVLFLTAALLSLSACGAADAPSENSAPEKEQKQTRGDGTEIILNFGEVEMSAEVDDSETTRAFLDTLPLTITMHRYADREYYAAIPELPENGEAIEDFENGDITYYTAGKSLLI